MGDFVAGLRHGVRLLRTAPGFVAMATTILAVGIGVTVVMYALVDAVLLRALPFMDPERLVWMYNLRSERDRAPLSAPDVDDYRREATTLAGLAVFTNWTTNISGAGEPERLEGIRVSGDFFEVLGAKAAIGRLLQPQDETTEARVTVLTPGLWRRRFGGDAAIVGQTVSLNGAAYVVVGVLPERFLFPFREAEVAVPLTLRSDPRRESRGANFLRAVARVASGATLDSARADLNAIARRLQRQYPNENARKTGVSLYPLHAEIVRDYDGLLWTLLSAVGVLLLAGCVNLANLMLVRAVVRRGEFAVRASLGASRRQLIAQLLGESTLLVLLGAVLGLGLAQIGLAAWRAWGPADFPQMRSVVLNWRLFASAATIATLTAVVCGAAPAWFASKSAAGGNVASRSTTSGRGQNAAQRGLVVVQVAAAAILLVGMVLMARGLARLEGVEPGFTPSQALSVQMTLPPGVYGNAEAVTRFVDALRDRLASTAGVERAGVVSLLPLSGLLSTVDIVLPDRPAPPPEEVPQAHLRVASADYFDAAGIELMAGRAFDDRDRRNSRPVAVVSRTFVARHWPAQNALGRFVAIADSSPSPMLEVVGVIGDVKQFGVDAPPTADLYVPVHQMPPFQAPLMAARLNWVVRGRDDLVATTQAIRRAVAQIDPGVAVSNARTLASVWRQSLASRRATVRLLESFAVASLLLSAVGVYGVAAFAARARRRELALRAALGATRRDLMTTMLRAEVTPAIAGLVAGLVVAAVMAPTWFGTLFDPGAVSTYAGVAGLLASITGFAVYVPIRSAARVDAKEALQE